MPEAVIIDYGVGNLLSLKCALEKVGLNVRVGLSARQLKKADAVALRPTFLVFVQYYVSNPI